MSVIIHNTYPNTVLGLTGRGYYKCQSIYYWSSWTYQTYSATHSIHRGGKLQKLEGGMKKHFRLSWRPSWFRNRLLFMNPPGSEWKTTADKKLPAFYTTKRCCLLITQLAPQTLCLLFLSHSHVSSVCWHSAEQKLSSLMWNHQRPTQRKKKFKTPMSDVTVCWIFQNSSLKIEITSNLLWHYMTLAITHRYTHVHFDIY